VGKKKSDHQKIVTTKLVVVTSAMRTQKTRSWNDGITEAEPPVFGEGDAASAALVELVALAGVVGVEVTLGAEVDARTAKEVLA